VAWSQTAYHRLQTSLRVSGSILPRLLYTLMTCKGLTLLGLGLGLTWVALHTLYYVTHTPMCSSVHAAHRCAVLYMLHTDVQFCTCCTHRCVALYTRHTPMCSSVHAAHTAVQFSTANTRSLIITQSINNTH
jgi:hypothetical protein